MRVKLCVDIFIYVSGNPLLLFLYPLTIIFKHTHTHTGAAVPKLRLTNVKMMYCNLPMQEHKHTLSLSLSLSLSLTHRQWWGSSLAKLLLKSWRHLVHGKIMQTHTHMRLGPIFYKPACSANSAKVLSQPHLGKKVKVGFFVSQAKPACSSHGQQH